MKTAWHLKTLLVLCPLMFVSCETITSDRVNEMPLPGYGGTYVPQETEQSSQSGSDLLNQIQDSSTLGATNNTVQTPQLNPGRGNIANDLNQAGISVTPQNSVIPRSTGISNLTRTNTSSSSLSGLSSLSSTDSTASSSVQDNIPTAWPTSDPNIVLSPYDSSKRVSIQRKDGTRWESGKVLLDTNFPKSEKKLFRVP